MQLSDDEKYKIHSALNMWANYIETKTVTMSAIDAARSNKAKMIQSLSVGQHDLVRELRDLAIRVFNVV